MFDRQEILRRAVRRSSIDFLKSEKAANAVVARLQAHFGSNMPPGTIYARESARHPGTWRVDFYHLRHAEVSTVNRQVNQSEADRIAAAIQAVFRRTDLVTSWTRPPRRSGR